MELQFNKSTVECLHSALSQLQTQEQTQELRLSDGLPDVGRILGCWGQVMIRGKEWHGGYISVSGGVNVWVLYAPEDGTQLRCIDGWIPFQMKWDFLEELPDGRILVQSVLKSADARGVSPRKIMVRVNISCHAQALVPTGRDICAPGQIPEDVCLLKRSYPMMLPKEAGEKLVQLDDELPLKGGQAGPIKLQGYQMTPWITEQRVMTDKLIFRGKGQLQILCSDEDGKLHTIDQEISFSQYAQLEKDLSANAQIRTVPVIATLELEPGEGKLYMKAGILVQYLVYDQNMVELVEDAYSTRRAVLPQLSQLDLPVLLDSHKGEVQQTVKTELSKGEIMACCWRGDYPSQQRHEQMLEMEGQGQLQLLYLDEQDQLQGMTQRGKLQWQLPSDADNRTLIYPMPPQISCYHDQEGICVQVSQEYWADTLTARPMQMVTGLDLGEYKEPDPHRPSLILRRGDHDSIWELAKSCGSTVDAIKDANGLGEGPVDDRLLLIPVV